MFQFAIRRAIFQTVRRAGSGPHHGATGRGGESGENQLDWRFSWGFSYMNIKSNGILGSLPEKSSVTNNFYNTCPLFNANGMVGKFRKVNKLARLWFWKNDFWLFYWKFRCTCSTSIFRGRSRSTSLNRWVQATGRSSLTLVSLKINYTVFQFSIVRFKTLKYRIYIVHNGKYVSFYFNRIK